MGLYTATSSWKRIVSDASSVLISSTGTVRVFVGSSAPTKGWDAGVTLRGRSDLQLWDIPADRGNVYIMGDGEVRVLVDDAAKAA